MAASRDDARGVKPGGDGRLRVGGREGVVYLVVSGAQLQRALFILQGLFEEVERRDYELRAIGKSGYEAKAGVAVRVGEHSYHVQVVEQTARIPLTEEELARWQQQQGRYYHRDEKMEEPTHKSVANGRLKLQLLGRFGNRNYSDTQRLTLESRLAEALDDLVGRTAQDDARVDEQRRRQEEWRRQEEERQELALRARIEQARAARLTDEVRAWRLAGDARDYVAALRARLDELEPAERERVNAWCDWAEGFAMRTDPTQNTARMRGLDDERDRFHTPPRQ